MSQAKGTVSVRVEWRPRCAEDALVVDGVDAGSVLPHEQHSGDDHATEQEAPSEHLAERRPEPGPDRGTVVLDLDVDLVDLADDVRVLGRELADKAEVLDRLVATVASDEPSRRLANEEGDTESEQAAGDEPARRGRRLSVRILQISIQGYRGGLTGLRRE